MASSDRQRKPGRSAEVGGGTEPPNVAPSPPDGVPLDQSFDRDGLFSLRSAVSAHGLELGLAERRLGDLVLIANELAGNAIRHGGGQGRLLLWSDGNAIYCQVTDHGPGLADPESAGTVPVPVAANDGRGLWIIRRLSDSLHVSSGPVGATITATVRLPAPS